MIPPPPRSTLFPYTTLFRSDPTRRLALCPKRSPSSHSRISTPGRRPRNTARSKPVGLIRRRIRSEEHTSELQSLTNLVCRLLLEKKKKKKTSNHHNTDHTRA